MSDYPMLNKIIGHAVRSKLTLVLDEDCAGLLSGLKDAGFKVIPVSKNLSDNEIKNIAEGYAIVTQNRVDFWRNDMKVYDYDLIDLKNIKFMDNAQDKSNQVVQKIVQALRSSKLPTLKGNFHLTVNNEGFTIEEILI